MKNVSLILNSCEFYIKMWVNEYLSEIFKHSSVTWQSYSREYAFLLEWSTAADYLPRWHWAHLGLHKSEGSAVGYLPYSCMVALGTFPQCTLLSKVQARQVAHSLLFLTRANMQSLYFIHWAKHCDSGTFRYNFYRLIQYFSTYGCNLFLSLKSVLQVTLLQEYLRLS